GGRFVCRALAQGAPIHPLREYLSHRGARGLYSRLRDYAACPPARARRSVACSSSCFNGPLPSGHGLCCCCSACLGRLPAASSGRSIICALPDAPWSIGLTPRRRPILPVTSGSGLTA